ncbi:MAG: tetratricopeptide repeat protein, partial [Candidatus Zixiibacteriota bacterium]
MEKPPLEIAARRFLNTGQIKDFTEDELARECDALIQKEARRSLKSARVLADSFIKRAGAYGRAMRLTAYRTMARVSHMSGAHADALKAYLDARKLALSEPLVRGRIDRALVDVYMYTGNFAKARQAANRAIKSFGILGSETDLAQTQVNYANLLHRQDRHREAEKLYRKAGEFFEKTDNRVAVARCYFNRANTLVQLFQFNTAEQLYRQAMKIYDDQGYALDSCDARYGIAWLLMLGGSYHIALLELAACEKIYNEGGDPRGEALCSLDRAEVYLSLGLYRDALETAREVERRFAKIKLRYEQAKAALFRGQAASALGLKREAVAAMKHAMKEFSSENNRGFTGVVHLLAADLAGKNQKDRLNEIKTARKYFSRAQLPLWEAVCDLHEAADPGKAKNALARLSQNGATRSVPHLFALWQTAYGDYDYALGRTESARRRWRNAAERIDSVRAQLPPLELRSAYGSVYNSPHLKLINSELTHDISMAAIWSERYKTAGVWSPLQPLNADEPARRNAEESLDALAHQVAALARHISPAAGERSLSSAITSKAMARLQKQVRLELIAAETGNNRAVTPLEKISEDIEKVSQGLPIIQFHIQREEIIAFVHRAGETALHRYPGGHTRLTGAMQRWRFILEGELLGSYLKDKADGNIETAFWAELGEWLWTPLKIEVGCPRVLILPEGELANIPWQALIVDGKPLIERHHFIMSPSLRHYLHAESILINSSKIELFRGSDKNLPYTIQELEIFTKRAGDQASIYNPIHRTAWPAQGEARLWHFTGHAELRTDNPFYSYLVLEDGPLFAADFRLKQYRVG